MKQEQFNSLLRMVLTFLGALLASGGVNHFFGHVIDTAYWQEITGVLLALSAIYWGWKTKTLDIEKQQGLVRQVIAFIMGILTSKGIITQETALAVVGFVGALLTWIQSGQSRKKAEDLSVGKIKVEQLKGSK